MSGASKHAGNRLTPIPLRVRFANIARRLSYEPGGRTAAPGRRRGAAAAPDARAARAAGRARRRAGARAGAERGDEHAGRPLVGELPRDGALSRALRRPRDRRARPRPAAPAPPDRQPRPPARARGLPVGQPAAPAGRHRAASAGRAPRSRGPSRSRSSTARPRSSTPPWASSRTSCARSCGRGGREAARAGTAARRLARRQGKTAREQDRLARSAEQLVYAQLVRDLVALDLKYGLGRRPDAAPGRPRLRQHAGVRPQPRRDDAEGALRLPVPVAGVGGDPGALEAGPVRRRARPRHGARAARGRDARLAPAQRPRLHGHGRAGPGRGPRGRAGRVGAAAARRRRWRSWRWCSRSCSGGGCGCCRWPSRSARWP